MHRTTFTGVLVPSAYCNYPLIDQRVFYTPEQPEHRALAVRRPNREWEVNCSCGAKWTHDAAITEQGMLDIYESHLRYANRTKLETL